MTHDPYLPDAARSETFDAYAARRAHDLKKVAQLMDSQFHLPGTPIRLGLDTIIGLIPGVGDTISLGVSGWIIAQSARLGVRKRTLIHMSFNVFIDWLIGLVPIIGDIFDVGWRGNLRNIALLEKSLGFTIPAGTAQT